MKPRVFAKDEEWSCAPSPNTWNDMIFFYCTALTVVAEYSKSNSAPWQNTLNETCAYLLYVKQKCYGGRMSENYLRFEYLIEFGTKQINCFRWLIWRQFNQKVQCQYTVTSRNWIPALQKVCNIVSHTLHPKLRGGASSKRYGYRGNRWIFTLFTPRDKNVTNRDSVTRFGTF